MGEVRRGDTEDDHGASWFQLESPGEFEVLTPWALASDVILGVVWAEETFYSYLDDSSVL